MCLPNGWCYVAPKMAWGEARRGSIAAVLWDRGATKPQAIWGATLRAAGLFASRFVARSFQTHQGYARRSRLAGGENPLQHNTSHLGDTSLASLDSMAQSTVSQADSLSLEGENSPKRNFAHWTPEPPLHPFPLPLGGGEGVRRTVEGEVRGEGQGEVENFRRVGSAGISQRLSLTPTLSRWEREHGLQRQETGRNLDASLNSTAVATKGEAAWAV